MGQPMPSLEVSRPLPSTATCCVEVVVSRLLRRGAEPSKDLDTLVRHGAKLRMGSEALVELEGLLKLPEMLIAHGDVEHHDGLLLDLPRRQEMSERICIVAFGDVDTSALDVLEELGGRCVLETNLWI